MIIVKQVSSESEWKNFLLSQPYTLFVQSSKYGKFYNQLKEDYWIFGIYDESKLIGGSLVVSTHAKRGNFLYLPYGPILDFDNEKIFNLFKNALSKFAKENNYDFIRISPFANTTRKRTEMIKKAGFIPAPMHMLAETTWLLDITQSEDKLLENMKKNHRNLIRRCIKDKVRIELKNDQASIDKFNELHDITAKKHKFHRFSKDYIKKEFNLFSTDNEAVVINGYLQDGRLDASAIIVYYGNTAAYRHAASLSLNNKIPTSYLIQWNAIKEAKKRGLRWYNFWGIVPDDAPKTHPFAGITHFKKGFGGFQKDLIHCADLPISKKYWINWTIETFRRKKRGF